MAARLRTVGARAIRSRTALIVASAVVVLAIGGTTLGYTALAKSVTLSLDGQPREVSALGGTVGDVLEKEGVEIGEHDLVAPAVDTPVQDGTKISVRFGRPLTVTVDGQPRTYWVTSTEVEDALGEIGRPFAAARLSTSRGTSIGRDGLALSVVTPKALTIKIGDRKWVRKQVTALTVEEALAQLGVKVGRHDETRPALGRELSDGDRLVFTDVRIVKRTVRGEEIGFDTVEREDDSMYEGETEVVREGRDGLRDVTYRLVFRNGELDVRKVVTAKVRREPVDEVVRVGTKEVAANFAGGNSVWDRLAECESGGNWATNTGNGYYGGLQFSLSTWQAYGGPGMPHQQSRETQIAIATKVRDASGGYGAWPHCSAQLGLPR